jgi:hypothetical protein
MLNLTGGVFSSNHSLDGIDGVLRVGNGLPFSDLTDQSLATVRKGDHGGRRPIPFLVGYDNGISSFHDGDTRICRSQINPYNFTHLSSSSFIYPSFIQ